MFNKINNAFSLFVILIYMLFSATLSYADYVEMVTYRDDDLSFKSYLIPTYGLYYPKGASYVSMPSLNYCNVSSDCKFVSMSTDVLTTGVNGTHPAQIDADWEFKNGANIVYPQFPFSTTNNINSTYVQYISRYDLSSYNLDYFTQFRAAFAQVSFGGSTNNSILVTRNDLTIAYLVKSSIRLAGLVLNEPLLTESPDGSTKLIASIQSTRVDGKPLLNLEISHLEAKFTPILANGTLDFNNQYIKIYRPNTINNFTEKLDLSSGKFRIDFTAYDYAGEKSNSFTKIYSKTFDLFKAPVKVKSTSTFTSKVAQILTTFTPPKKTVSGQTIPPSGIDSYVLNIKNPKGATARVELDNSGNYSVEWSNGDIDVLNFVFGSTSSINLKDLAIEGPYEFRLSAAHQTDYSLMEGTPLVWSSNLVCTEIYNNIRCPSVSMKNYILKAPVSTSIKRKVIYDKVAHTSQLNVSWTVNKQNLKKVAVPLSSIVGFCIQITLPDGTESLLLIPKVASYTTQLNIGGRVVNVILTSNAAGTAETLTFQNPPAGIYKIGISEIFNNGVTGEIIGVKSAAPKTTVK